MRALAHPVRLAILSRLQRYGPATATQLSEYVGASPSVTSWHLRHLATFDLVLDADPDEVPGDRRQRWWKAPARGFTVELGDDPEAQEAGRLLVDQMLDAGTAQVQAWRNDAQPALEPAWMRLSGPSNTQVMLTTEELDELEAAVDALLAPYVHRPDTDAPDGARRVRVLRYYLPSASE